MVQELLLRGHLASTEGLLQELLHLAVLLGGHLDLGLGEVVGWARLVGWKGNAQFRLHTRKNRKHAQSVTHRLESH